MAIRNKFLGGIDWNKGDCIIAEDLIDTLNEIIIRINSFIPGKGGE